MNKASPLRILAILVACCALLAGGYSFAQSPNPPAKLPDAKDVISFLNQTIAWYHHFAVEQQLATQPSDVLIIEDNRLIAGQVVRLAFDFARAEAQALESRATMADNQAAQSSDPTASRYENLKKRATTADATVKEAQTELVSLRQKLEDATGAKRKTLLSTISEVQSELELAEARRDAMRNMVEFLGSANGGGTGAMGLRSQIEGLERTVPGVAGSAKQEPEQNPTARAATPGNVVVSEPRKEPSGILGLITDAFQLSQKIRTLDETIRMTEALTQSSKNLRSPYGSSLRGLSRQGDTLAAQADSADPATLAQQKTQLDQLTARFKQVSAAVLPLSKQGVLLDLYKRSLVSWRDSVKARYVSELKSLGVRLAMLAIVLLFVIGFSELWRKAIFRYVPDIRRRHQFLLLRRFVQWFVIAIVIAFSFATELGSLVTFAGLLTAGAVVALQNVILSIAGYFFLIGKYGVRIGDRVQISGVTGEVMDVGLVRLHLMELGTGGADAQPTGRVVAFSNSVVFQPSGGVFKQIPGTNFVWHEITLTLAPESNYREVEERLVGAVESVYAESRERMERQRRHMEKTIGKEAAGQMVPQSRLRLTKAGLEVVIRYPLELDNASEFDDRITRELLDAIEREPKLKLVGTGTPNIQQAATAVGDRR